LIDDRGDRQLLSVVGSVLSAAVTAIPTWLGRLLETFGVKSSSVEIILLISLATLVVFSLISGRSAGRPFLAFACGWAAFAAWAFFRTSSDSFVFSYAGGPARSESMIAASFLVLAGCIILALNSFIDRDVFLWAYGTLSLGSVILNPAESPGIWDGRSLALAGIAFSLASALKVLRLALTLACTLLVLLNGHQGPLLAFGAAAILLFFARASGVTRIVVSGLTVMTTVVASQALPWIFGWLDQEGTGSERLSMWQLYLERSWDSLVFGHGFGTTTVGVGQYPHNAAVDVIYGLGFVGVIVWMALLYEFGRGSWRSGLAPLWVSALVMSMFSGAFPANAEYWLIGGISIALARGTSGPRPLGPNGGHVGQKGRRGHFKRPSSDAVNGVERSRDGRVTELRSRKAPSPMTGAW